MTYRAPVADIAFALKHAAGFGPALAEGLYGDLDEDLVDAVLGEAGPVRQRRAGAAQRHRRSPRHPDPGRRRHHPAGLAAGLSGLGGGRLERAGGAGAMGRPGPAAGHQRGLHRDVELGLHGVRHRPGADHGGRRCAHPPRQRRAQAHLSAQARLRRMDGHHAAHRAAGRLRRRRAAHQGRARRRRQLPDHRAEDLHHLRRARFHRQHHSSRAGAAAGRAARHARHLAVPGAQIRGQCRTARSAPATTCAPIRSSTSSASTARPPAPWCMATRAAPPVS